VVTIAAEDPETTTGRDRAETTTKAARDAITVIDKEEEDTVEIEETREGLTKMMMDL